MSSGRKRRNGRSRLRALKINEVSIVDEPAIGRKFTKIKNATGASEATKMDFAQKMREAREAKGMELVQLAEATGLDAELLAAFEAGDKMPDEEQMKALAEALDMEAKASAPKDEEKSGHEDEKEEEKSDHEDEEKSGHEEEEKASSTELTEDKAADDAPEQKADHYDEKEEEKSAESHESLVTEKFQAMTKAVTDAQNAMVGGDVEALKVSMGVIGDLAWRVRADADVAFLSKSMSDELAKATPASIAKAADIAKQLVDMTLGQLTEKKAEVKKSANDAELADLRKELAEARKEISLLKTAKDEVAVSNAGGELDQAAADVSKAKGHGDLFPTITAQLRR